LFVGFLDKIHSSLLHYYRELNLKRINLINEKFIKFPNTDDFICYRIFKYDSTIHEKPSVDTFFLRAHEHAPMLLDTLIYLKDIKDDSLAFRRSCREGICGSCAMNINGVNALACTYRIDQHVSYIFPFLNIYPLPHMVIVKDLVIDMKHFYNQYRSINPFLIKPYEIKLISDISNSIHNISVYVSRPTIENLQSDSDRRMLNGLYECILCACCTTSCPSYWWHTEKYLGPAVLLQAYRWIIDSRDLSFESRLEFLNDTYKLKRCHLILNCIRCCPKKLSPATAISNIKYMIHLYNVEKV
jgi:succinate dehydrogenase/fumarate reductase iron-sulfur protein